MKGDTTMKAKLHSLIFRVTVAATMAFGFLALPAMTVQAACPAAGAKVSGISDGADCSKSAQQRPNLGNIIETVTNVLLFVIGAIAVIMIIIGGLKYTLSNGDSAQITSAKNTILYAVVGIVVALLAYAIVNFVTDAFIVKPGAS